MVDKLLEAIIRLVPFATWLEQLSLSKEAAASIAIVLATALLGGLSILITQSLRRLELQKNARRLDPQFDYAAIRQATRYYIPTQSQNASPARQDEPGFTHQHVFRGSLILFFLKNAFNYKTESERFYLILADSGMGKTTFMINLYLSYHNFFNFRRQQHSMRLLRFSHPDTMNQVNDIKYEEARNTILLLDALDEDPYIVPQDSQTTDAEAFKNRLDDIIAATRNFAEVIITCRTQYFPDQEDNPYEIKVKRPDEHGFYTLRKLYLSPFTEVEVKQYLRKKYGLFPFINRAKKQQALRIVGSAKHLVMRPMMLSHIDLLVGQTHTFDSDYAIYETLVEEWLKREADKRKYREAERKAFIENLRNVSNQTALALLEVRQTENRTYLSKTEAIAIAKSNNIPLRAEEVTGQSLLTCDGVGNWKFAHESVWEFLLAKRIFLNPSHLQAFQFTGMDMTKHFITQKLGGNFVYVEGGTFQRGNPTHQVKVSGFWMSTYPVTQAEYQQVMGKNPSKFKGSANNPVENVSWYDAAIYCNKLNQKHGYAKTYDKEGSLLTPSGLLAQRLSDVIGFRLPTEAEWEYAARGGNQSHGYEFSGSNNIDQVAWYEKNSGNKTHPVGQKDANELGLHDMSGNVWEWCSDWYEETFPIGDQVDPMGPALKTERVNRGGGAWSENVYCRPTSRFWGSPAIRGDNLGFRLVLTALKS